nr:MAG TPA: minor capsid protein [Caudoviricetes sp.]
MLTPKYLKKQPEHIVRIFESLEDEIIEDISRRIAKNLQLTETAEYQIEMMTRMGYDIDEIEKKIAKTMNVSEKELEKILNNAAETSYENDRRIYKKGGKELPLLDKNPKMIDFIEATVKQSKGTMRNLSNTIGFADKSLFKPFGVFYKDTIDYAVFQLGTGAFDYNTVLRQAVKKIGDSGLRTVDYESGRRYHIESAVRMNVLTAMSQITGYMSLANADMMGQDLMEITAHMGARPSHAEWQGQIVSREGRRGYLSLEDIGYGDVEGFKGANCRHDWFPFFEGISERVYTDEELENIDPPDFEYEGKTYTAYDATQKQRYYERQIRQTKRNIIAYDAAGLKDDFTTASIKLKRQREEYERFSRTAGIRPKHERHHTYSYDKSKSMKAVWARR